MTVNRNMLNAFKFDKDCRDPRKIYENFRQVGEGASGKVYEAVEKREGPHKGRKVALKYCDL